MLARDGASNAGAAIQRLAIVRQGLLHSDQNGLSHRCNTIRSGNIRQDDGELVTAQTRNCIGGAYKASQSLAEFLQQSVTSIVTEPVIGLLEMIQIQDQQTILRCRPELLPSASRRHSKKSPRLGKPVRIVVIGRPAEALLGKLFIVDVLDRAVPADQGAVLSKPGVAPARNQR